MFHFSIFGLLKSICSADAAKTLKLTFFVGPTNNVSQCSRCAPLLLLFHIFSFHFLLLLLHFRSHVCCVRVPHPCFFHSSPLISSQFPLFFYVDYARPPHFLPVLHFLLRRFVSYHFRLIFPCSSLRITCRPSTAFIHHSAQPLPISVWQLVCQPSFGPMVCAGIPYCSNCEEQKKTCLLPNLVFPSSSLWMRLVSE